MSDLVMDAISESEREFPMVYIGDGVYASFDGYQVWLRTERYGGIHAIALEPEVLSVLDEYVTRIREFVARGAEETRR